MKLSRLKAENLFSYSSFRLDFDKFKPGIILIEGIDSDNPDKSNGVGKSSIFEIINWILFHDTIKGGLLKDQDSIIRRGAKFGSASIEFYHGKHHVIVHKRRDVGKTTLQLLVDGLSQDVKTTTEVKKYLEEFLNIKFEVWKNSIVFGQNSANLFFHGSSKDRNDLVGSILNFDILDGCLKLVRDELKSFVRLLDQKRALRADVNEDIGEYSWYCGEKVCSEGLDQRKVKLDWEKSELSKYKKLVQEGAEMKQLFERKSGLESLIKSSEDSIKFEIDDQKSNARSIRGQLVKSKESILKYSNYNIAKANLIKVDILLDLVDSKIANREVRLDEVSMLKYKLIGSQTALSSKFEEVSSSPKCPVCDQKIKQSIVMSIKKNIEKIAKEIHVVSDQELGLETEIQDFKNRIAGYNDKKIKYHNYITAKVSIEGHIGSLEKELDNSYSSYKVRLSRYEIRLKKDQKEFDAIEIDEDKLNKYYEHIERVEQHEQIVEQVTTFYAGYGTAFAELSRLEEKVNGLDLVLKDIEVKMAKYLECEQVFGQQGVRNLLVQKITPSIEQKINSYLVEVGKGNLNVSLEWVDKFDIVVSIDGKIAPIHSFSGGEDKLLSILFHLALSEVVLERGLSFHFQIMDESFDNLDLYNSNLLVELFHAWAQKQSKLVFLITHNSQVRDLIEAYASGSITCIKKNGVSTLACSY